MIKRPYVILEGFEEKYPVTAIFWHNDNLTAININFSGTLFLHINEDNNVINSKGNIKGKIYYD